MNQNPPSGKPLFSSEQRKQLRTFGLNKDHVNELESALQLCRVSLLPPPTRGEVRDELQALSCVLQNAQKLASKFLQTGPQSPARQEALHRVMLADTKIRDEDNCIKNTLDAVSAAHTAVQRSILELPKTQLRYKVNPFAVRRIEEALWNGFLKRHRNNDPGKSLPSYPFERSSSPGSSFREIVGICYEAMGQSNTDPERAIKKHIEKSKESKQAQRKAVGIEMPRTRKRTKNT